MELGRPYLPSGTVVLVGRLPVTADAVVACIRHSGGRKIRVAVVMTGASEPAVTGQEAVRAFIKYGIQEVEVLDLQSREQAESLAFADRIENAHVVLLCGDDAAQAHQVLVGTVVHGAISRVLENGRVVVGVGAVGALLGDRFLVPSTLGEAMVQDGLGLLPRMVLPAGFDQVQGYSRLIHAVGSQLGSHYLGVNLDSAAALVLRENEARILGEGSVTFMDGSEASYGAEETLTGQGAVPVATEHRPVCGLKLHVLVAGYGLNLRNRRPMGPPGTQQWAVGGDRMHTTG